MVLQEVEFPAVGGMNFHKSNLPLHENGMTISAYNGEQLLLKKPITPLVAALLLMKSILVNPKRIKLRVPYPYQYAADFATSL